MVMTGTMLREKKRSRRRGIVWLVYHVRRVRKFRGQDFTYGGVEIQTIKILDNEVGYEITHDGWIPSGTDFRNGFHKLNVQVFAKKIGRKLEKRIWCQGTVRYCSIHVCVLWRAVYMLVWHRCVQLHTLFFKEPNRMCQFH